MDDRPSADQTDYQALLRQQTVLAQFGQFALKSEDLDEILTEACRLVGGALGTDLAKVMELQDDGETIFVRAGVGWKPGVVGVVRIAVERDSSEGYALKTGEPAVSPDIDTEQRFRYADFLRENGVRAIVNVIILGGRNRPPFGLLQVDSRVPRNFNDDDTTFLRGYANLLAAAVDRLRVLGEVRGYTQELERRVAERTRELTAANARLQDEVAERGRTQAALRQAGKMETVFEHLPVGAGLVAPSGRVIFANPEFRRLLPHPSIPAPEDAPSSHWTAHDDKGARLAAAQYPGNLALRGELALNLDFLDYSASAAGLWRRASGIPVRDEAGEVVAALMVMVDVDAEKRAAARQRLMIRELDHRAKNMLAVVQAAVRLTRAGDMASFVRAVEGRLKALARAQTLLADEHWAGADLRSLLRGELAAFLDGAGAGPRVVLQGSPVALPARAVQPFSMAVHELATNAIKYGALSVPAGRLDIGWHTEPTAGGMLRLRWTETGGPVLSPAPMVQGFGSRVLNGTLRDQLGGKVGMAWAPTGLVCEIAVPLAPDRDIGVVGQGAVTPLAGVSPNPVPATAHGPELGR